MDVRNPSVGLLHHEYPNNIKKIYGRFGSQWMSEIHRWAYYTMNKKKLNLKQSRLKLTTCTENRTHSAIYSIQRSILPMLLLPFEVQCCHGADCYFVHLLVFPVSLILLTRCCFCCPRHGIHRNSSELLRSWVPKQRIQRGSCSNQK